MTTEPFFNRKITSVHLLCEFAETRGVEADDLLAGSGITRTTLKDHRATVSAKQEMRVIANLCRLLSGVPALGTEAGLRYHFTAFGTLGFAMASSPNLRAALETTLQHFTLTFALSRFHVNEGEDVTEITLTADHLPKEIRAFVLERDIAAMIRVQRDLLPGAGIIRGVAFPFPHRGNSARYRTLLETEPDFDAPHCVLNIDRKAILAPLPSANAIAHKAAQEQCSQMATTGKPSQNLACLIRKHLMRAFPGMPDMETVAADFCMTSRTLRRHLGRENTSFTQIRDEVRETIAKDLLLTTSLSIAEIAYRLGFACATSFINAFKKWTGQTPLAYRRAIQTLPYVDRHATSAMTFSPKRPRL